MKRLIIASEDSSGGCLKAAGFAEQVVTLGIDFLMLPAPLTTKPLAFFAARSRLIEPQHYGWDHFVNGSCRTRTNLRRLAATARPYDRVEIWADPDPNAQIQLMWLLSWLAQHGGLIGKLFLFHSEVRLGDQRPEAVQIWRPQFVACRKVELNVAKQVWQSFRQVTPLGGCTPSTKPELAVFPFLADCLKRVLRELPDRVTGLTWTQSQLLKAVKEGARSPRQTFVSLYSRSEKSPVGYWALGHLLCGLATCERSAISGTSERAFTLGLFDDAKRRDEFMLAPLQLTDFGERLLEGREDFSRHNRIDFWWGGCRVANDNLWRWDAAELRLIAPP